MKRILLLEFCFLFLATTFQGDRLTGWVQQTIPRQDLPILDLQFLDSLNGFFISTKPAVDTAFVFRTTNGGNNWSTTYFDSLYLVCMDFVDKNVGYCGGAKVGSGILKKTTNGGNNWFTVTSIPFILIKDVDFLNKDTGWISYFSLNDGLLQTTNGGQTWQLQTEISSPSKIFFVNNSIGWVIGNSGQNLYKTTNSGLNWFVQSNFGSSISDVFFATPDTGFVVGGGGNNLKRTTNGGTNWYDINISSYLTSENRLFLINNKTGWAGSAPNKIFATKDGYNWGVQTSPIYANDYVSFIDTIIGWAGASGLVHTSDGGGPIVSVNPAGTELPEAFVLYQNYPNPFNQLTIINYQLSITSDVKIKVHDINGKEIAILVNERKNAGKYSVSFNANKLSSGIYFYRMIIDNQVIATKKMSLIK